MAPTAPPFASPIKMMVVDRTGEAIRVAIIDVGLAYILMGRLPRRDRRGFFVTYGMKHGLNRLSCRSGVTGDSSPACACSKRNGRRTAPPRHAWGGALSLGSGTAVNGGR